MAGMEKGRDYPTGWCKWFYCWLGALWYTSAAVALSLPLLSTCLKSQWSPGTHTLPHTHTLLHWSFWASPYAASAKALAVHHPQLPWQQSCTQTACRLAMWPWMQAHPHTSHTHTLQHNMYTQPTVTNTSSKITKTHWNAHTQAPDEHDKAHTRVQRTLSKRCLCRGRPYVFTAAHSQHTHSSLVHVWKQRGNVESEAKKEAVEERDGKTSTAECREEREGRGAEILMRNRGEGEWKELLASWCLCGCQYYAFNHK